MASSEALDWEVDIIPDGNLILVLTHLDRYDGNVLEVLNDALVSKANSNEKDLDSEQVDEPQDSALRRRPRTSRWEPLWGSKRVRSSPARSNSESSSIRVRVAAEHFSHSSPVFRLFVDPSGNVGSLLSQTGQAVLPLPEDDAAAMILILLVLFNLPHEVTRQVDVQLLTEICILIDRYELHTPLSLHTDGWYGLLEKDVPTYISENFMEWLCITHVLSKEKQFGNLTSVARQCTESSLNTEVLPIPQNVLESIEMSRIQTIDNLRAIFQDLIEDYKSRGLTCKDNGFGCDCTLLGSLELNRSLSTSLSSTDFDGLSVKQMVQEIKRMKWPRYTINTYRRGYAEDCDCRDLEHEVNKRVESVVHI